MGEKPETQNGADDGSLFLQSKFPTKRRFHSLSLLVFLPSPLSLSGEARAVLNGLREEDGQWASEILGGGGDGWVLGWVEQRVGGRET